MDLKQQGYNLHGNFCCGRRLNVVLALDIADLASPDSPPPPIFAVLSQELAFQFYFFLPLPDY